jgi:hypothetical protein
MTMVLIHGGGATGAFWDRLVPLLDAPPAVIHLPSRRGRPAALETCAWGTIHRSTRKSMIPTSKDVCYPAVAASRCLTLNQTVMPPLVTGGPMAAVTWFTTTAGSA